MRRFFFGKMLFLLYLALFTLPSYSQEKNIVSYLKLIESGAKDSVLKVLPDLKKSYPNDPSIIYLDGILTENGQDAVPLFNRIINDYSKSKYADASVYRLYSYYYSLGLYNTAQTFLEKLKKVYPNSPYIKIAEREIPPENEPEASQENITSNENPKDYIFTIQAGAFTNESNAESLMKSFVDAGYYSYIGNKSVGGSDFSVVYVGRFKTREEADSFLQVVNKQFDIKGHIVSIN